MSLPWLSIISKVVDNKTFLTEEVIARTGDYIEFPQYMEDKIAIVIVKGSTISLESMMFGSFPEHLEKGMFVHRVRGSAAENSTSPMRMS